MSAVPEGLVSVVMPCYDAVSYVREAMESVLAQDHGAVELIVVDDHSTDGSWEVVGACAADHPGRVRPLRLERNAGGAHARNRGAALARGEFLMFLDADDLIGPGTLSALVEAARSGPDAVAICPWMRLEPAGTGFRPAPAELPLPQDGDDVFRIFLDGSAWAPTCSVLWRRDVYARVGGWDEALQRDQDDDLMLRAHARGARLARTERGMGFYRTHAPDRATVSRGRLSESKLRSTVRVLDTLDGELKRLGRTAAYADALGAAYQRAALLGFQNGHAALARECQDKGETLGGRQAVSRTALGRLLSRLLGVERKERLLAALARVGIATPARRREMRRASPVARGEEPAPDPNPPA